LDLTLLSKAFSKLFTSSSKSRVGGQLGTRQAFADPAQPIAARGPGESGKTSGKGSKNPTLSDFSSALEALRYEPLNQL
jgi:hypothetical protein